MYPFTHCNISSLVKFKRWWVLKSKLFGQESASSKEFFFFKSFDGLRFVKKCQNRTFKVNFLCQKSTEFFQKKISSKNINLGDHFLLKTFFIDSIFEPLYFLKLGPIFVGPTLCQSTKYSNFIWLLLIFEQKPCFLGPIKRETPWRNWH